jgi:hypothetical protein
MSTHEENLKFCRDYHAAQGRGPIGDSISPKDCRCYRQDLETEIALKARCVVGMPAYRVYGTEIETGELIKITRCTPNARGDIWGYGDAVGTHDLYIAMFRSETLTQTYEWKFFIDRRDAQKQLCKELASRITEKQREIEEYKALIAENSP